MEDLDRSLGKISRAEEDLELSWVLESTGALEEELFIAWRIEDDEDEILVGVAEEDEEEDEDPSVEDVFWRRKGTSLPLRER